MRRREFLAATGGLVVSAVRQRKAASPEALMAFIERQVPVWQRQAGVPGLPIALIQNADVVWHRGFGFRELESKAPIDDRTVFEAASMSKPVFAYVVMKLAEQSVIDLDAPLTTYTPERFLVDDARLDLITARQVLSHTSGFQNWRSENKPLAIHFTPGSRHLYSGEGYNYLQTVVTRLMGEPFDIYMRRRLLQPLQMASSGYLWDDAMQRHRARGYDADRKAIPKDPPDASSIARYGAAGGLRSTPTDYARFMIAFINPPPPDTFRLRAGTVQEMIRPHVRVDSGEFSSSWALGWQIFHSNDRDFIFHAGDNKGFKCGAVASVAARRGYVAMTNGENGAVVLSNILTSDAMQAFLAGQ